MAKPAAKAFITSKASGERLPIKGHINQMRKSYDKAKRAEVYREYSNPLAKEPLQKKSK